MQTARCSPPVFISINTDTPDWISFEFGTPGHDLFPVALIQAAFATRVAQPDFSVSLQYGPALGDRKFRCFLAQFLTERYAQPVSADHLCVTNGASQSFLAL